MSVTSKPQQLPAQPGLILTAAQAEAVYSAMCALNNVGGRLRVQLTQGKNVILVEEFASGGVVVDTKPRHSVEVYAGQHAFATAYVLLEG